MAVKTVLVIDNYDSFTYNLVQMFRSYPLTVEVFRNDNIDPVHVAKLAPDYILISPGPKDPAHAGISMSLIKSWHQRVPILGVCLGMQCINEVFGGRTVRARRPLHGKTSDIFHNGRGLFAGMPSPFQAARYHSLAVAPNIQAIQSELVVSAWDQDRTPMALSHRRYPLHGMQFHPESFLTRYGVHLIDNFLRLGPMDLCHARNAA
ncbi:MAG: aminodeoxychorismate/anthranilate synthase component II [Desulfatitalea sp.]|nr:aminodeoxychorismate/anthranilate synthase component II [Desulfatitalea sp.]NNJ99805.1 aminodeoxychorismate/anthranilate synthase component II [Desulfatitalea sp.]